MRRVERGVGAYRYSPVIAAGRFAATVTRCVRWIWDAGRVYGDMSLPYTVIAYRGENEMTLAYYSN